MWIQDEIYKMFQQYQSVPSEDQLVHMNENDTLEEPPENLWPVEFYLLIARKMKQI